MNRFLGRSVLGSILSIHLTSCGETTTSFHSQQASLRTLPGGAPDNLGEATVNFFYRDITINPQIATVKPVVKFLMVIDDSESMVPRHETLKGGVRSLIKKIGEMKLNLDVRIITTSDLVDYGRVSYRYQESGILKIASSEPNPPVIHQRIRPFLISNPVYRKNYEFREGLSENDFNKVSADLEKRINTLSLEKIPDTIRQKEKGICSAIRVLHDADPVTSFVHPGDKLIVLFISDEDSNDDNCLINQIDNFTVGKSSGKISCTTETECEERAYLYSVPYIDTNRKLASLSYNLETVKMIDGTVKDAEKKEASFSFICSTGEPICQETTGVACNETQKSNLRSRLTCHEPNCKLQNVQCNLKIEKQLENAQGTETVIKRHTRNENLCGIASTLFPQVTNRTYSYDKCMKAFSPSSSIRTVESAKVDTHYFESRSYTDAGGDKVVENFHLKAKELFGENGYRSVAIIRDQEADTNNISAKSCPAAPSTTNYFQYGLKYRKLALKQSASGSPTGSVHSICSGDYAPALGEVQNFIQQVLASSRIKVNLESSEVIKQVHIVRGSDRINLSPNDVKILGDTIEFALGILKKTDQVIVKVGRPQKS